MKICGYCGTEFSGGRSDKIYCSSECQQECSQKKYKARKKAQIPIKILTKNCNQCDKEFTTINRRKAYCSRECKIKYNSLKRPKTRKRVDCKECGKNFEIRYFTTDTCYMCVKKEPENKINSYIESKIKKHHDKFREKYNLTNYNLDFITNLMTLEYASAKSLSEKMCITEKSVKFNLTNLYYRLGLNGIYAHKMSSAIKLLMQDILEWEGVLKEEPKPIIQKSEKSLGQLPTSQITNNW